MAKRLSARSFGPATAKYRELGTAANLLVLNRLHALPTRNFQQGSFAGAADLSPKALAAARQQDAGLVRRLHDRLRTHLLARRPAAGGRGVRVEYESLFALGPLCGIGDPDVVLAASRRCDELGLDTISLGGTVAFAMECVERGWLDAPWLPFGDGRRAAAGDRADRQPRRTGRSAGGGQPAAGREIGHGALDFAPQVKGLEIPGYEPRALQTMALGFAVGTRGADHNRSSAYEADFSERVDRRTLTPAGRGSGRSRRRTRRR